MSDDIIAAERAIGLRFNNPQLLRQAFIHRSYLNEFPSFPIGSNERLEFLGDAVLGFLVAEHLYTAFPEAPEGTLSTLRAALVRASTLAKVGATLDLERFILMARGEYQAGTRIRPILIAHALEAVIGAIFLDQGIEIARQFVARSLIPELNHIVAERAIIDAKSRLQELTQAATGLAPSYVVVAAAGPDHARWFTIEVRIGNRLLATGEGSNKRIAEQSGAQTALEQWGADGPIEPFSPIG